MTHQHLIQIHNDWHRCAAHKASSLVGQGLIPDETTSLDYILYTKTASEVALYMCSFEVGSKLHIYSTYLWPISLSRSSYVSLMVPLFLSLSPCLSLLSH